ncbi:MAG: hypothetical protein JW723_13500 [Bacteroidales bacterium]|nr:hypothetical protein [Bacteroidales bacterium]
MITNRIISSLICLAIWLVIINNSARCQFERQGIPVESKHQTLVTEPTTLPKGFFRVGIYSFYIIADRYFDENSRRKVLQNSNQPTGISASLNSSYGISDRLEMNITVPFSRRITKGIYKMVDISGNVIGEIPMKVIGQGIGDIYIEIKWQVIQGSTEKASLLIGNLVTFPTGRKNPSDIMDEVNFNEAVGKGEFIISPFIGYKKIFYPYSLYLDATFSWHSGGEKIFYPGEETVKFKPLPTVSTAAKFSFHINDWIAISNMVFFNYKAKTEFIGTTTETGPSTWAVESIPYLYFQIRKMRLGQAVSIPLAGRNTGADPSFTIILQYIL